MTKDIQRAILRACAEFIKRKLEPLEKRLSDIETKTIGVIELKAAPIVSRVEQLEARQLQKGDQGEPGPAGKDADPVAVVDVAKELLSIEGFCALVDSQLSDAAVKYFKENPVQDGRDGEPGPAGKDAEPVAVADVVAELLTTEQLTTLVDLQVAEAVAKYFEANPVQHGRDGVKGDTGERGEAGVKGEAGADGVGLAGAMIDRDGNLVVTKTNGEAIALGCVVGKDGASGRDGKDGADFSDVELDYDGERGLIIRGKGGQIVKRLPIPIDRGFWREDKKVEQGDVLTHDGNVWIALKDTSAKPCRENSDDWRLMVRRGRDGLQGPPGKAYEPPQPIKLAGSQ